MCSCSFQRSVAQVVILRPVGGILLLASESNHNHSWWCWQAQLPYIHRHMRQMAVESVTEGHGKEQYSDPVKDECGDQESHHELQVKQEIKEEIKEEPEEDQEGFSKTPAKRRRLTRKDMPGLLSSVKKEGDVKVEEQVVKQEVEVKEELGDGHEILPELGSMEAAAIWQQVKKEIKEEMQQEMGFAIIPDTAFAEQIVKQEPKEETDSTVASKRRRLTRKGQPSKKSSEKQIGPASVKEEADGEVSVKKELVDSPGLGKVEPDALWLQVSQKIKEELSQSDLAAASGAAPTAHFSVKREQVADVRCNELRSVEEIGFLTKD